MFRRIAILLAITTVLLLAVIALNLTSLSTARAAAPSVDAARWEYALMIYTSKKGEVTLVMVDNDEQKEIMDVFQSIRESTGVTNIPAVYYANVLGGRYAWELVTHDMDASGEMFYFKRQFSG